MKAVSLNRPTQFHTDFGRVKYLLSFSLVLLVFFAAILGGFHHHHDLNDHPDCAVCAAVHIQGTAPDSPTLHEIILPIQPVQLPLLVLTVPVFRPTSHLRSRAPPQ